MTNCVKCWVSGRVQGVFFRASTQEQAQKLGITGYAKNLPDGRVEVLAYGEAEALEKLTAWLHLGSPLSQVSDVQCENILCDETPEQFNTY